MNNIEQYFTDRYEAMEKELNRVKRQNSLLLSKIKGKDLSEKKYLEVSVGTYYRVGSLYGSSVRELLEYNKGEVTEEDLRRALESDGAAKKLTLLKYNSNNKFGEVNKHNYDFKLVVDGKTVVVEVNDYSWSTPNVSTNIIDNKTYFLTYEDALEEAVKRVRKCIKHYFEDLERDKDE